MTDGKIIPGLRPLRRYSRREIALAFERTLSDVDALTCAHCLHELWMRGEPPGAVMQALERLWRIPAPIPDWLPMSYVDFLPTLYEVSSRFKAVGRGRSNIYLVLLDYPEHRAGPHGVYVGMSRYSPEQRFDQHKAGIRAAGCVLKRGVEVLTGPARHLQGIARAAAARIEVGLGEALAAEGILVKGGH